MTDADVTAALRVLARGALDESASRYGGSRDAEVIVIEKLKTMAELQQAAARVATETLVRRIVLEVERQWNRPPLTPDQMRVEASYRNHVLANGVRLADARRADLMHHYRDRKREALAAAREARWVRLISEAMPDESTRVGDVLSETDLQQLFALASTPAPRNRTEVRA